MGGKGSHQLLHLALLLSLNNTVQLYLFIHLGCALKKINLIIVTAAFDSATAVKLTVIGHHTC